MTPPNSEDGRSTALRTGAVPLLCALAVAACLLCAVAPVAGTPVDAGANAVQSGTNESGDSANATARVERRGDSVVAVVPAERVDEGPVSLRVAVPEVGANVAVNATRAGDGYVAAVPLPELLPTDPEGSLASEVVYVRRDGETVASDRLDLRYAAVDGESARFEGVSLAMDADVRGVDADALALTIPGGTLSPANATLDTHAGPYRTGNATLPAGIEGSGPNATVVLGPDALGGLDPTRTYEAVPTANGSAVGPSLDLGITGPAAEATAYRYVDGDLVLSQPLVHPAVGGDPVSLVVETRDPDAVYAVTASDARGVAPVPSSLLGAGAVSVTVVDGDPVVEGATPAAPPRERVPLRIDNGSLHAPDPGALAPYDAVVLRAEGLYRIPIGEQLRAGDPQPLGPGPASVAGGDALLVGDGTRPAAVDLSVNASTGGSAPDPTATESPGPAEPDTDEFVGLWLEVGAGAALLLVAMVGASAGVGLAFAVRLGLPASTSRTRLRAALANFLLGGAFGLGTIALLQTSPWWDPALGTTAIAGVEVGTGALVVGGVHGGLTATGLRIGLGAGGAWPSADRDGAEAVPVRVTVTDDAGEAVPGEQTVVAQRPTGAIGGRATVGGTTTELDLAPGEWELTARVGDRESDPTRIRLPVPKTSSPEPRTARIALRRPRLGVAVADADTGDAVDGATVAVTTAAGKTRSEETDGGRATFALPMETEAVSVEVRADRYDPTTVERRIDRVETGVEVDLDPATGRLRATAVVDDDPVAGARLGIEPGGSTPPEAGTHVSTVETDEDGVGEVDLPVGSYRVAMDLEGPNAHLFDVRDAVVSVEDGAVVEAAVRGRFNWALADAQRRRVASLRETVERVAAEAPTDPTVPLYFACVATELLDAAEALPETGHLFAASTQRPDAVAAATVAAAEAVLGAVGRAMQAEEVRRVLAAGDADPQRVHPSLDVDPAGLLAHLDGEVSGTIAERASEVADRVDAEATTLDSVAPARAMVEAARSLPEGADSAIERALREYAALLIFEAVEELFERRALRRRL